jgi:hypothetical protein
LYSYLSVPLEGIVEKRNITCKSIQSFVYPDDIVVIARNITFLTYVLLELEIKAKKLGLRIGGGDETKYMKMFSTQCRRCLQNR